LATYLLVHGGWLGGWYWRRVASILREASHEVFTPTLTGLGEQKMVNLTAEVPGESNANEKQPGEAFITKQRTNLTAPGAFVVPRPVLLNQAVRSGSRL
jgi:hypothetical protein